tara:strand:+ start:308 stop:640 length:333 start_codon:yes stop_codon:yes gene_type:complete
MDVLLNFKFSKPILSQSELVSMFGSMSESALKRFMKDWLDAGNDIREMGMFRIDGVRENQWEPTTFTKWLYENKINKIYKYDYEVKEQNDLTANLIDISNKRRKNVSNQN